MVLVDTNVLIDVLEQDPAWARWSVRQLEAQSQVHQLVINPVIFAELSLAFDAVEDLVRAVDGMALNFRTIPRAALFLAGKAFARYRHLGGTRPAVLPDFFIGAHAAVLDCAILTRDRRRYEHYFPGVPLITPPATPPPPPGTRPA